ncbi:UNVERIFIED_CONTAM: hypothetical protein Sradi_1638100 [Sesamum radiatum]|uniref:DUF4283 domain-containing protein n=1 Tax=Sesamum radiatum TaxID=300843 RepID=A0AAW2UBT5_SESRA
MEDSDILTNLIDKTTHLEFSDDEAPIDQTPNPTTHFPIVAKVLCDKPLNHNAIKATLSKAWNIPPKTTINAITQNTLVFLLENEDDCRRIWRQSPWSFRGNLIVSKPWYPEEALADVDLSKYQIWAQVIGLPVVHVNKKSAEKIGNLIGKFIGTDLATDSHRWRKALRIRTEIDVANPLKDHIIFRCQGNRKIVLEIRYERLGDFCHVCGIVGHKFTTCPENPKSAEGSNHHFRFGPWLKAENDPIPNPFIPTYLQRPDSDPLIAPLAINKPKPSEPAGEDNPSPILNVTKVRTPMFTQNGVELVDDSKKEK